MINIENGYSEYEYRIRVRHRYENRRLVYIERIVSDAGGVIYQEKRRASTGFSDDSPVRKFEEWLVGEGRANHVKNSGNVGRCLRTGLGQVKNWCFRSGHAGGCFNEAFEILSQYDEVSDCMIRDKDGGYEYGHRCLFDIMVNPLTQICWAVFIADVLDANSKVFVVEL